MLDGWGSNNTGTSWSWDQSDVDGTTLTRGLVGDGVRSTQVGAPVTSSDRDDGQLGDDDGTSDGVGQFLGSLDTQTNVTVVVTKDHDDLHSGSLTSSGLLLNRDDGHDLFLQVWQQVVDDLVLLDWQGVGVDLLDRGHLTGGHKST